MRNPLKRIVAVFIFIALLPFGFILFELNALTENEKIVREIYENQLDAILYSINQYSDDVIGSWANRFNIALMEEKKVSDSLKGIPAVLNQFAAVRYIYCSDVSKTSKVFSLEGDEDTKIVQDRLDSLVKQNQDRIKQLMAYEAAGFRKMELMDTINTHRPVPVFFVLGEGTPTYRLGVMVIDLPEFIESTIGPKLQAIAQDKFVISAFRRDTNALVYSTDATAGPKAILEGDEAQKKSFWLLPGYYLSISLSGATIDDLVRDRMITSLIILGLLATILGLGIWFLYRNIRREMSLAQAKSEFVSNVSHEIRTPLSLISMYAETLEMNRVTEEKKLEYQSVIAKEAARLSGIVNRILNFSQIQANKKTYEAKPLNLNELVDEVLKSYFFHLRDKGFTCELIKDENLNLVIGDRNAIVEAFINLIDNAMKYSQDKKNITIKTGRDGNFNFVEVKDEGMGIAKKHQSEIFDQFYRAPTGDIHNTKGSGLGLTLVKKTMEAHHGKIKVESAPGKGSTFRLYFPIKNDPS
jgi:two-component system, OmpR family, phosphate regulon sensor histidine kinase PhoR